MSLLPDLRVIACNYTVATKTASLGAACFVLQLNPGGGNDRIQILSRSRGGRWIDRWESTKRLGNFRVVTIPPEHPRYRKLSQSLAILYDAADAERLCELIHLNKQS